jgi:hypothetical protein
MAYRNTRTDEEIDGQLNEVAEAEDSGSRWPSMSYEQGVKATLEWVIGTSDHPPMSVPGSRSEGGRLPRTQCPVCGGQVAVRSGGELREHPDHRHPLYGVGGAVREGRVPKCPGSGQTFPDERDIARGEELARQHGW